MKPSKILTQFLRGNFKVSEQAAASAYLYESGSAEKDVRSCHLDFDFVRVNELQAYINEAFYGKIKPRNPNILQHFVLPKDSHNSMIKVNWTPLSVGIEMATNKFSMYDNKCTLQARTVTFEGLDIYSKRETI